MAGRGRRVFIVLFYTLGVEYYSTPKCYTEQISVLFSTHILVLFSISRSWMILNVVQYCSVFFCSDLGCRIALPYIYIYMPRSSIHKT